MRTITPHRAATLAIAVIASFAAGCGATSSDKAGGTRIGKPVVLTMANGNGDDAELDPFASAVSQMSNGTLRIVFHNHWRTGSPGYETGVIHDVAAGKADLGWAGSRAFDSVGVASFDALNAPLLIDSYPLQRTALESPLASQMLDALKPLGVVGLGILPGPLRKPLGSSRLVGPQDYRGKKIAIQDSQIARATLRALGATAHAIPSGGRPSASVPAPQTGTTVMPRSGAVSASGMSRGAGSVRCRSTERSRVTTCPASSFNGSIQTASTVSAAISASRSVRACAA